MLLLNLWVSSLHWWKETNLHLQSGTLLAVMYGMLLLAWRQSGCVVGAEVVFGTLLLLQHHVHMAMRFCQHHYCQSVHSVVLSH